MKERILKADNYAEYELCCQCFSRNFLKTFRTVFSKNTVGGMLLILCDCSLKISRTPFTLERKGKYISKPSSEYLPVDVPYFIEEHLKASDEATLNLPREKDGYYQKGFLFTNRFFLLIYHNCLFSVPLIAPFYFMNTSVYLTISVFCSRRFRSYQKGATFLCHQFLLKHLIRSEKVL